MSREPLWRRYLRFWRPDVAADVDDEIAFHLEERAADLVARGATPAAARAQARAEFGDVEAVRAALRAAGERRERRRGWAERVGVVRQDVAYAARSLTRAPGLVLTVVLTLALGLGANGAVYALADRLFLRPPPGVVGPAGVRRLYITQLQPAGGGTLTRGLVNYPEVRDVAAAVGPSARVAAYETDARRLGRGERADSVNAVYASADYFAVLGVRPALGRFFGADEARVDAGAPVAVLSDALWRRRFGGDPGVLGRVVDLERERVTVIGVAPPRFAGVDLGAADLWLPLGALRVPPNGRWAWHQLRNYYALRVLLRPAPGADVRRLVARATTELRRGATTDAPADPRTVASFGPITAARGPDAYGQEASMVVRLAGVALAVLLVACANVANLLLARGVSRRREIAVRLALGVRAGRLRALLVTEGVLLALAGGAAALLVAAWGGATLRAWLLPGVRWDGPPLDARVAVFLAAAALLTGVLAGLAPAARVGRSDLTSALVAGLKTGARDGTVQRSRLRSALVGLQAALSVALLVGAGLFVRSLANVRALDVGYDAERLVFASVTFDDGFDVRTAGDASARAADVADGLAAVAARLARRSGVERVALATVAPMRGEHFVRLSVDGRDSLPASPGSLPTVTGVSPEFFAAAGLHIVRGRAFTADDRRGAPPVLVVNRTMARTLWPGRDALGGCVRLPARTGPCYTVVGIAEDGRRRAIVEAPSMMYYVPLAQTPALGLRPGTLVIRAAPERVAAVTADARQALAARFPDAEPYLLPMAVALAPELRPWRLGATLFSLLGGLALAVAAVGVYSAVAYTAGQRRQEFAVRLALGGRARDLTRVVVGDAVRPVTAGVAAGVVLALAAGRLVASMVYGVSPHDPVVLAAAVAVLLGVALLASLAPARRAARVDLVDALRAD